MSFFEMPGDKEEVMAKIDAAAEHVKAAFIGAANREGDSSKRRHMDPISVGYQSALSILDMAKTLEITKLMKGEEMSPALRSRLRSLGVDDIASVRKKSGFDVEQLVRTLCLDDEVHSLAHHRRRVFDGWKGVQGLLLLQMNSLFENLYSEEEQKNPQARQFFHETTEVEDLTKYIMTLDVEHIGSGGYGEIFRTDLTRGSSASRKVAVKTLRYNLSDIDDLGRKRRIEIRLRREIRVWKDLHHINVVPLLGLVHGFNRSPFPSMVCPWMPGGTLANHLIKKRATLTVKDRFQLLSDIINGLSYLHSKSVIHGDLTHVNILISENTACLSDFGLSEILSEFVGTSFMTIQHSSRDGGGAVRWAAPELFFDLKDEIHGKDRSRRMSKACDIWSFGCIVQEVISGYIPYFDVNEHLVQVHKLQEILPTRPNSALLTNEIWDFIQLCWRSIPEFRPEVSQVSHKLQDIRSGYSTMELAATLPPLIEAAGMELD